MEMLLQTMSQAQDDSRRHAAGLTHEWSVTTDTPASNSHDENDDDVLFAIHKKGSLQFLSENPELIERKRSTSLYSIAKPDISESDDNEVFDKVHSLNSNNGSERPLATNRNAAHNFAISTRNSLGFSRKNSSDGGQIMWKLTFGNPDVEEPSYRQCTPAEFQARRAMMQGIYSPEQILQTVNVPESERTTVMLRNMPNKYSREDIMDLLHEYEYAEHCDFLYAPVDLRSKSNMGYCFINFSNPKDAADFKKVFTGFTEWKGVNSQKKCLVDWAEPYQGLAAHIDRYRNSPIMHHTVCDDYKPALYSCGEPVPFPKPTIEIEPPKVRRCARDRRKV